MRKPPYWPLIWACCLLTWIGTATADPQPLTVVSLEGAIHRVRGCTLFISERGIVYLLHGSAFPNTATPAQVTGVVTPLRQATCGTRLAIDVSIANQPERNLQSSAARDAAAVPYRGVLQQVSDGCWVLTTNFGAVLEVLGINPGALTEGGHVLVRGSVSTSPRPHCGAQASLHAEYLESVEPRPATPNLKVE